MTLPNIPGQVHDRTDLKQEISPVGKSVFTLGFSSLLPSSAGSGDDVSFPSAVVAVTVSGCSPCDSRHGCTVEDM